MPAGASPAALFVFDIYPFREAVEQEAAGAAADVQDQLAVLTDDVQIEEPVVPIRGVIRPGSNSLRPSARAEPAQRGRDLLTKPHE